MTYVTNADELRVFTDQYRHQRNLHDKNIAKDHLRRIYHERLTIIYELFGAFVRQQLSNRFPRKLVQRFTPEDAEKVLAKLTTTGPFHQKRLEDLWSLLEFRTENFMNKEAIAYNIRENPAGPAAGWGGGSEGSPPQQNA
jgi:hypothetical protein